LPGARTHDVITVVTGLALVPIGYSWVLNQSHASATAAVDTTLLVGAHLLSGIMFSPDLDIDSAIDNRWGMFYWIWRPYMWIVPHRSPLLSHGLVIPPLLRLLYFFAALALLYVGLAWGLGQIGVVLPDYYAQVADYLLSLVRTRPREVLAVLIGFVTGGAAHSIADWLVTDGKHLLHGVGIQAARDYSEHDNWERRHAERRW
jgi:uncharacterized metal-binding protein